MSSSSVNILYEFFADSRRALSFEERNRPFQTAIMTSLKHREITGNNRRRLRLLLPPLKLLDMPLKETRSQAPLATRPTLKKRTTRVLSK